MFSQSLQGFFLSKNKFIHLLLKYIRSYYFDSFVLRYFSLLRASERCETLEECMEECHVE